MTRRYVIFHAFLLSLLMASCAGNLALKEKAAMNRPALVPAPSSMQVGDGVFEISNGFQIQADLANPAVKKVSAFFADVLRKVTAFEVELSDNSQPVKNALRIELTPDDHNLGREGYLLDVSGDGIRLSAQTGAGLFYGVQTLMQLLPPNIYADEQQNVKWTIPFVTIKDVPRYRYRGMHLDVCRHFFPPDFIKKYIDLLALHKMNTFHWHLTEDQGWRIEIKKYPKLTRVSAYRDETLVGHAGSKPEKYDGKRYGGFYTQEEIKDIVEYAQERYVTIIPEIEMPGHALAALAAYPELSCTGGPFKVGTKWGVFKDVYCAGNDRVFDFLQNVLSEVIELFPGKYIHIGGDECPKTRWKECPKCQARIKSEGLKDEHELQSYFIRRIEKFLLLKGKRLIGWDEILEGGLAPEATVMSWRGIDGGIAAARQGHDVIMTPNSHLYFDHYQADPKTEPLAIGGYTTLKKVYSYDPTPPELTKEEQQYILGAQANVWTEYIATPEQVEYMALPRMCALAEVVWTPKEKRSWKDFQRRLQTHLKRFDVLGVNYAKGSYGVSINTKYDPAANTVNVYLESEQYCPRIFYTTDGSEPTAQSTLYTGPISLDKTTTIKAGIFEDGLLKGVVAGKKITVHKALGKKLMLRQPFSSRYPAGGEKALIDGLLGSKSFNDGIWQGFNGSDLEAVIDLNKTTPLKKISTGFIQQRGSWIFMPLSVDYAVSMNGRDFRKVAHLVNDISDDETGAIVHRFSQSLSEVTARYIKVFAKNRGTCPPGHPGAGGKAWLFADEIIVE